MSGVVAGFYFEVLAVTRDECVSKMDDFAMECLHNLGGAPWVCVDDDTQKTASRGPIRDEQGFCYEGKRKYIFNGPVVDNLPGVVYFDGFKCQGREEY